MKISPDIDRSGTAVLFLIATVSFFSFPFIATEASATLRGNTDLYGSSIMWVSQVMVLISMAGLYFSYRRHRFIYPLIIAIPSGMIFFYGYYFNQSDYWTDFIFMGMFGLFVSTGWNHYYNKCRGVPCNCTTYNVKTVELNSLITCPKCGHTKNEIMPTNACVYFYECEKCKALLKPLPGDCCVFCSYGTVKCPPVQAGTNCC